jgi:hypothetical protein
MGDPSSPRLRRTGGKLKKEAKAVSALRFATAVQKAGATTAC